MQVILVSKHFGWRKFGLKDIYQYNYTNVPIFEMCNDRPFYMVVLVGHSVAGVCIVVVVRSRLSG